MILYAWTYSAGLYIRSAVIDSATSIIWVTRYNSAGEFEIYVRATQDLMRVFETDNVLITRDDTDIAMIVDSVTITTDAENGDYMTIAGQSAEGLIGRRIVPKQTIYSGTAENVIRTMMIDNIVSPVYSFRRMSLVTLGESHGWTETIEKQVTGQNLLTVISDICVTYNYGFKMPFRDGGFVFELYKGVDRSYDQDDNTFVVFSSDFEDLGNTTYRRGLAEYYNSVYVAGEGQGSERVIVEVDHEEKTGIELREKWVDARNVSSTTDGGTLTPTEYTQQLVEQGDEELKLARAQTEFNGEVLTDRTYAFGVDYDLGDKVQIVSDYGITATARVVEVTEVEDGEGHRIVPTLSTWEETTA